jgi:hypothetical protein
MSKICPKCGFLNADNAQSCSRCGTILSINAPQTNKDSSSSNQFKPQKKSSKRWRILVIVIVVAVILTSLATLINYEYYSPFQNVWGENIQGQNIFGIATERAAYIVSSQMSHSSFTFYYKIYKFNLTSGAEEWRSKIITFSGKGPQFTLPQMERTNLYYYNGTLYLSSLNNSGNIVNYGKAGNFAVYGINSQTGSMKFNENITPLSFTNNITFGYSICYSGNTLTIGYISELTNPTINSTKSNASFQFHLDIYSIGGNSIKKIAELNTTLSLHNNGWGTGDEYIFQSGSNIAYFLTNIHIVIIENITKKDLTEFNLIGNVFGILDNNLYYSKQINTTVSFYKVNILNNESTNIITLKNILINANFYEINAIPKNTGGIAVEVQNSEIGESNFGGTPLNQTDIRFLGFSSNKTMLWNITIPPDPYGTFTQMLSTNNGNIILATQPGAFSNGISYHSNIIILNGSNGKIYIDNESK